MFARLNGRGDTRQMVKQLKPHQENPIMRLLRNGGWRTEHTGKHDGVTWYTDKDGPRYPIMGAVNRELKTLGRSATPAEQVVIDHYAKTRRIETKSGWWPQPVLTD